MKTQIILFGFVVTTTFGAWAAQSSQRELSSHIPKMVTYKITDGYGEYTGTAENKIKASAVARESCIMEKVLAYESRHGVTPDADTTDLFIDACINK